MRDAFNRLLNVRNHEWSRLLLFFGVALATNIAGTWGGAIAYANFPNKSLPQIQILSAVLSLLVAAVYFGLVDRVPDHQLLIGLYAIGAGTIGLGWIALGYGHIWAYQALYLFDLVWTVAFNAHFATFISNFYDIHAIKRILPLVFAGFRTGVIIAGVTQAPITDVLGREALIGVWATSYLVIAIAIGLMMIWLNKTPPTQTRPAAEKKPRASYIESLREGLRYTQQSSYLRWMAANALALTILLTLLEFESRGILIRHYGTGDRFSNTLALLSAIGNAIVLPLLLFGISRIITNFGLGVMSLAYPLGNLGISGALAVFPTPASAIAGYYSRTALRTAIHAPVNKLLYNAVPVRLRGRARASVDGLIMPIGTLIGGILSFLPAALPNSPWLTRLLILVLAVACWISAVIIRREYGRALVKMLEQEDYSFLLAQESAELTLADPTMLARLQIKLETNTSHEGTIFLCSLILQVGARAALPILHRAAQGATEPRTRAAILDTLSASTLRGNEIGKIFTEFLADANGLVRQAAIAGLEALVGTTDKRFTEQLLMLVNDPDLEVRARVLSALMATGDFFSFPPAVAALESLLVADLPHECARGVHILGQVPSPTSLVRLRDYLASPADEVRLEAILAVETRLSANRHTDDDCTTWVHTLLPLLHDPVEAVRQAALGALGALDTPEALEIVADALTDASAPIRAAAADVLLRRGGAIIPIMQPRLNTNDLQLRKMAAFVLSRVAPKEFDDLILECVMGNLEAIYSNAIRVQALQHSQQRRSIAIISSALSEQNQALLEEIFYLLTALHEPTAIAIIHESLQSTAAFTRANASEALETLTTPKIAGLITPLFNPDLSAQQRQAIGTNIWELPTPTLEDTLHGLAHDPDPWLRALTVFALGEIGAALVSQSPTQRRRQRVNALLDVLSDSNEAPAPTIADDSTLTLTDIESLLADALLDEMEEVRDAAQAAQRLLTSQRLGRDL